MCVANTQNISVCHLNNFINEIVKVTISLTISSNFWQRIISEILIICNLLYVINNIKRIINIHYKFFKRISMIYMICTIELNFVTFLIRIIDFEFWWLNNFNKKLMWNLFIILYPYIILNKYTNLAKKINFNNDFSWLLASKLVNDDSKWLN